VLLQYGSAKEAGAMRSIQEWLLNFDILVINYKGR